MSPAFRKLLRPGLLAAQFALLLLGACAPTRPAHLDTPSAGIPAAKAATDSVTKPVDIRIVYVIHGDADYTFHDSLGKRLYADQEALEQALRIAKLTNPTEVFIFHQRPSRPHFFDGVQSAGTFYHYNAGVLLRINNYSRNSGDSYLQAESRVLKRNTQASEVTHVFAYFGHEIPLAVRSGYSASDPDQNLSISLFAAGLNQVRDSLMGPKTEFDLIVLSTCYGGAPAMMRALAPLTKQAIASPAYLHLSYLNTRALGDFRPSLAPSLADSIAAQSFQSLKGNTQTEITVGVYNLDSLKSFLESSATISQQIQAEKIGARNARKESRWRDCANLPGFDSAAAARGVSLYYKAPRFGALKSTATRSAWQCRF